MTSNGEFNDTDSLNPQRITDLLLALGSAWREIEILSTVDSTNAEVSRRLSSQITQSTPVIVMAEEQTQGRGRLDRTWSTPKGTGIALSFGLLADQVSGEPSALPLRIGLAASRALAKVGVAISLKWPNDLVFATDDGTIRKCGGILVQQQSGNYVVGIGINVRENEDQLPTAIATSLLLEGHDVSRNDLIANLIHSVESGLTLATDWLSEYVDRCISINQEVFVSQLSGPDLVGRVNGVLENGALLLATDSGELEITVGDVQHAAIN
ncbi:MAG: biotin--[acetyl-CoA-carboxylase] ligase [Actinomycetales bacterium]|nr:biotin--[acetyl-CoA-carboxylase] ligase [Actinomycetales bacterium]